MFLLNYISIFIIQKPPTILTKSIVEKQELFVTISNWNADWACLSPLHPSLKKGVEEVLKKRETTVSRQQFITNWGGGCRKKNDKIDNFRQPKHCRYMGSQANQINRPNLRFRQIKKPHYCEAW